MRYICKTLLFAGILLLPLPALSQALKTVSGEYTLTATSDMSIDQAREEAVSKARLQALADAYGTSINAQTLTTVTASQDKYSSEMTVHSLSDVKGEWIADTRAPEFSILSFNLDGFVIRAKVWGRTREIVKSDVDIDARVLCGGTEFSNESDTFKNGDEFYLYFRTPADGYLSVYLMEDDKVYCLLPYRNDSSGLMKVSAGKDYWFFSAEKAEEGAARLVDEYNLTSDSGTTINHIYVLFSTSQFTKAAGKVGESGLHELSVNSFLKWMTKARNRDKDMQLKDFVVSIESR